MIKNTETLLGALIVTAVGLFTVYNNASDGVDRLIQSSYKYSHSPTAAAIKVYGKSEFIASRLGLENNAFPGALALIKRVMTLEHEEGKNGRFTLVHAKVKDFHLSQSVFKMLYETKHGDIGFPYIFTRFDKHIADNSSITDNNHKVESRDNLFLAPFCLGITLEFYLQNYSAVNYKPDVEKIFTLFEQDELYKKYKQELCQLQDEATAIYPYGQILLLSFSKDAINKYVYPTLEDGRRMSIHEYNNEEYGPEIDNLISVLSKFKENPKSIRPDRRNSLLEFCFCNLNYIPKYGAKKDPEVKIFRLGADPKKGAVYDAKERILLLKIAYEIQRPREQEINLMTAFLP